MAVEWRNNGEPIDGEYIADVDPEDGSQVQTFKGATYREVCDKLLAAQFSGSRKINELKKDMKPDARTNKPAFAPRELTADERFQAVSDAQDPSKLPEAIEAIVEARLGAPLEQIRARLAKIDEEEAYNEVVNATKRFVEQTPEWFPTPDNNLALYKYMEAENMAFTVKNFGIAFDKLTSDGLLEPKPEETPIAPEENATERIVPQPTRQRGSFGSTGIRSSQVSHSAPLKPKSKYTLQDIQNMPRTVYADKMVNEAGFAKFVDTLKA